MNLQPIRKVLDAAGVRYAVIGGIAVATHGFTRSTKDIDLFTTDVGALRPDVWEELRASGADVDLRRGDQFDPLRGVVRIRRRGERMVDVIVGKYKWEAAVVERAKVQCVEDEILPVVTDVDLVLLKLAVGGPKDLQDAGVLAGMIDAPRLRTHLESVLPTLPDELAHTVRTFLAAR